MTEPPRRKRSREEIAARVHENQRITIECGEKSFRCTRRTWTLVESSVLAVAVSLLPASRDDATLDSFFDEPPEAFGACVTYLRSGGRLFAAPPADADLDAFHVTAEKLGFARLAAHLALERVRRDVEREARYLDGQLARCERCVADWRRRTHAFDFEPVVLDVDGAAGAYPAAKERLDGINEAAAAAAEDPGFGCSTRRYRVAGVVPLAATLHPREPDEEPAAGPSTKVCVLLESERALVDINDDDLPDNYRFAARLKEELLFRRLGLQRLLSRLPADHRRRSTLVSATASTRALYRDLYAFQGHELNESDRGDEIEFEAPLYGLTGAPGGANSNFARLGPHEDNDPTHHTWAYEYDGDEDAPWFDAGDAERTTHAQITRLLSDLHDPAPC